MPTVTVRTALRAVLSLPMSWAPLVIAFAMPVAAQEASESAPLQEVVVTGIRRGIEDAIKLKENSGSIVEAISAEDIGKLPDTSIAESISRLPGLTSQRAEGRASAISLRGTDPGFTTTLLNGREQVSTGDNRSIEYDQYPSELLSSVVVYKTPDAQLIGQGLAGTIDLRTTRPLEFGKRALAFNVRGERNSDSSLGADSTDKGYRGSFSYIDQFMDNRLGVTFGVARLNSPLATEGFGTYEPWGPNGAGVFTTNGMKVRTDMGENTRDGAMAALEFRPVDSFTSILDLYYTKSHEKDNARSIEVNTSGYPAPCCDGTFPAGTLFGITNPTIRENSTTGGTLSTVLPLVRNFQFITDDKIFATGWNNKWSGGGWTLAGDVSYSRATRDQFQPENNAEYVPLAAPTVPGGPKNQYDTGQFQLYGTSMPSITFQRNYTDPSVVQLGPTIYGTGYVKKPHIQDELKSARIDVARELTGPFDSVAFGVNYADRSKDKKSPESSLSTLAGGFTPIASQYLLSPTNLSYAGAPSVLAWDVPAVMAAYYKPIVYGDPTTLSYLIGKWWTVKEKLTTSYIRGDLNQALSSSLTLKGNVGLQVIGTDQSSNSFFHNSATNAVTPFTDGKKYTDVLPEINLVFALPEQQAVRLGLAKEVARARMDQLKASQEIGTTISGGVLHPSGSTGNPRLDPWRADAADLSYEKYFSGKAYVSGAVFYKKLKSYIFNETNPHDFGTFLSTLPASITCPVGPPCPPQSNIGLLSGPVNGQGGNLKGVELTASLPGDMISDALRHFGTILSLAQTDSNITVQDAGGTNVISGNNLGTIPLPGLSKTVWSATFYYENAGFSARISTRARSKYIGEVTNFANDRAFKYVHGDQITDFQTGYEFGDRLQGLSLLFQINNMFNSPYIAYQRSESQQIDFQLYGRQFLFGVNYRIE
jgi:iron complex outermembrane receptor protein